MTGKAVQEIAFGWSSKHTDKAKGMQADGNSYDSRRYHRFLKRYKRRLERHRAKLNPTCQPGYGYYRGYET